MQQQSSQISESNVEYKSSIDCPRSSNGEISSDSSTVQRSDTTVQTTDNVETTQLWGKWEIIAFSRNILQSLSIACSLLVVSLTLTSAATYICSWIITKHMPLLTLSSSLTQWSFTSTLTRYTDAPDFHITLMIPLLLGLLGLPLLTTWFSRQEKRLFHRLLHSENLWSLDTKIAGLFRKGCRSEAEQVLLKILPTAEGSDYRRPLPSRKRLLNRYLNETQKSSSDTTTALRAAIHVLLERASG